MTDLKTTQELTRSPVDGSELVRLATPGANWKASLSSIVAALNRPWRPGLVYIEDFGGKADFNGTTGTDNLAPLLAAMASASSTAWVNGSQTGQAVTRPTVVFGLGSYYFSGLIDVLDVIRLLGQEAAQNEGTQWIFPANTSGIQFENSNTLLNGTRTQSGRGAQGSVLENISMRFLSGGNSSTNPAIRLRTQAHILNCAIYGAYGHAVQISATAGSGGNTEGNCNDWHIHNLYINGCAADGLHIAGNDANAGSCFDLVTAGVWTGCGIYDAAGLGSNAYTGVQITGYGNTGVFNGGHLYILIDNTPGIGGTTTPGTNDLVWYDLGTGSASSQYPQWVNGNTYILTRPIYCSGAPSVWISPYSEGAGLSHIAASAIAVGGVAGFTRYSNALLNPGTGTQGGFLAGQRGIGGRVGFLTGQAGLANNGQVIQAMVGTPAAGHNGSYDNGMNVLEHWRGTDGPYAYGWNTDIGEDIYYVNPNLPGQGIMYLITTALTALTFGRSAAVPGMIAFNDLALKNGSDARIYGARSAAPTSGAHAKGEFYFNVSPTVDVNNLILLGWSCTASGTPGTFTPVYVKTTSP